jgi:hypothetical protein
LAAATFWISASSSALSRTKYTLWRLGRWPVAPAGGGVLDYGRAHRTVPKRLRRALGVRDPLGPR